MWLERNNRIFREIAGTPAQVATKVKALIGELVASNPKISNETTLENKEHSWFQELDPSLLTRIKLSTKHQAPWEIRLEEQEFIKWRSSLNEHILQVDGASKGNLGPARSGGVLIDNTEKIIVNFSWGLGKKTNNAAEILAIWQGLNQARRLSIKKLIIIGDSRIIIQALNLKKDPNNMGLAHYHQKVIAQMKEFEEVKCYHVLWNLNHIADHEANIGASLSKGIILVNGIEKHEPIP